MSGMSRILENLFVGCEDDSLDEKQMTANKIAAVVRIDYDPEATEEIALEPAPRYHKVTLLDGPLESLEPHISGVNDFVHEARLKGEPVLIHCQAGVSRSASLTIAYLMSISKFGYDDALRSLVLARSKADPNWGFRETLEQFEKTGLDQERKRIRDKFASTSAARFDELAAADNAALEHMANVAPRPLTVFTMNTWDIPVPLFESPDRHKRMEAITHHLRQVSNGYDIVALQEVWDYGDYLKLKENLKRLYPQSYYFHSGFIGSGICIFTKGTIYFSMLHRYALNGYPHHVHRGDWFLGKIVGLVRVMLNGLKIDVYITHLHAEYDQNNDPYLSHRIAQAYELSQFIRGTSKGDVTLLMGDLNLEEPDVGYKLIISNARLFDAFRTRTVEHPDNVKNKNGWTWDTPWNSYTPKEVQATGVGERLDYILYRSNGKASIKCRSCFTTLGPLESNETMYHSDHEAVVATFEVKKQGVMPAPVHEDVLDEAIKEIDKAIEKAWYSRMFYRCMLAVGVIAFLATIVLEVKYELPTWTILMLLSRFMITLFLGFCFVYGSVMLQIEQKELESARTGMIVLKTTKRQD